MAKTYEAFLSYARGDDDNDRGRISQIRKILAQEVATQLGEPTFNIFQDTDDIAIGLKWQQVLDETLDGTAMLIGFISPRFFKRDACRAEVERFLDQESESGRNDLFIPVQYLSVPGSVWEQDPLAKRVRERQVFELQDLRFEELESMKVLQRVSELASSIVMALQRTPVTAHVEPTEDEASGALDEPGHDEPGIIELIAAMEEAIPFLTESIASVNEEITTIAALMKQETLELNASGGGTGRQKLLSAIRLTESIDEPIDRADQAVDVYLEELVRVEAGLGALFHAIEEGEARDSDAALDSLRSNSWDSLSKMAESIGQAAEFRTSLQTLMKQSSTLRKPLRRLDSMMGRFQESAGIWRQWGEERERILS